MFYLYFMVAIVRGVVTNGTCILLLHNPSWFALLMAIARYVLIISIIVALYLYSCVKVFLGNRVWMSQNGVQVGGAVEQQIRSFEEAGQTVVLASVDGERDSFNLVMLLHAHAAKLTLSHYFLSKRYTYSSYMYFRSDIYYITVISSLRTHIHTGVYVEKRPCH